MYSSAQDIQSSDNKFTYKLINKDINLCAAQAQTLQQHLFRSVLIRLRYGISFLVFRWHTEKIRTTRRRNRNIIYIKVSVFTVDV
jgi:hypothetical protein